MLILERSFKGILGAIFTVVLVSGNVSAQDCQTYDLYGAVTDENEKPIQGALIELLEVQTKKPIKLPKIISELKMGVRPAILRSCLTLSGDKISSASICIHQPQRSIASCRGVPNTGLLKIAESPSCTWMIEFISLQPGSDQDSLRPATY
jgi:hypothetical protein